MASSISAAVLPRFLRSSLTMLQFAHNTCRPSIQPIAFNLSYIVVPLIADRLLILSCLR